MVQFFRRNIDFFNVLFIFLVGFLGLVIPVHHQYKTFQMNWHDHGHIYDMILNWFKYGTIYSIEAEWSLLKWTPLSRPKIALYK